MSDEKYKQLDELSKKTMGSYIKKASKDAVDKMDQAGSELSHGDTKRGMNLSYKAERRAASVGKAADKITKEEYDELPEDEQAEYVIDESVASDTLKPGSRNVELPRTKIEAMTSVLGAMHGMKKEDMTKWFTQAMALIGKEASHLPSGASSDSNQSSIDMKGGKGPKTRDPMPKLNVREDVEEMFVGEELSEEFKDKATTLFEAAVNARAMVEVARLEEEYENRLEEEVTSMVESVEKNVDTYLDYVVEKWMEENQVAIESSLRNEIMEEFIDGLKGLFAEHYISMPEEKVDVVESLAAKVEELEASLDETINENAELKSILEEAHKESLLGDLAEGLTMTQAEKFAALAEGVSFDGDLDAYKAKLEVVKETYFSIKPQTSTATIEEETFEGDEESGKTVNVDPQVNRYVQAISRTIKK